MIALCAVYNAGTGSRQDGGDFISGTLRSFYETTKGRVPLLIIDDGSTDDTIQCIERVLLPYMGYDYAKCTVIHTNNSGVRAAMELALTRTDASIMVRFDSDVLFTPDWDIAIGDHMADRPECVIAGAVQYAGASGGLWAAGSKLFPRYQHIVLPVNGYRVCDTIMGCLSAFRVTWLRTVIGEVTDLRCETEDLCCRAWYDGHEVHCTSVKFTHLHYMKNHAHCACPYNGQNMGHRINDYMLRHWGVVWTNNNKKPEPHKWPRTNLGEYHDTDCTSLR